MKQEIVDALAFVTDNIENCVEEMNKRGTDNFILAMEIISSLRETANDIELILLNHGFNTIDNSLNK